MPDLGEMLEFLSDDYVFYNAADSTDWPQKANQAGVDLTTPIQVIDSVRTVRECTSDWGRTKVSTFVAVQFETDGGSKLWTNYSRDGEAWLNSSEEKAIELPTPMELQPLPITEPATETVS